MTARGSWRCTLQRSAHRQSLNSSLTWETRSVHDGKLLIIVQMFIKKSDFNDVIFLIKKYFPI